jgi:hypothetical protein
VKNLSDEELAFWASRDPNPRQTVKAQQDCIAMATELRERRAHDLELARLANVAHGYHERNKKYPRDVIKSLLERLDTLLETRDR